MKVEGKQQQTRKALKMNLTPNFSITLTRGNFVVVYNGQTITLDSYSSSTHFDDIRAIYNKARFMPVTEREQAIINGKIVLPVWLTGEADTPATEPESTPAPTKEEILLQGLSQLLSFFTEFDFTPSFRFTNTLAFYATKSKAAAKTFISDYFALMASSYIDDMTEKLKSKEFDKILSNIAQYGVPTNTINNRFKVYYGAAGTGKTTLAQTETENRCIVCNSSMLPSDLMENFVFKDGKPDFDPAVLWQCMEEGKPIVLDEINLLPFDSLRFLQGIVDGKTSFMYKNREVHIHDGFQIIGTMNLTLGGVTYGLPEPLVDRCSEIRNFKLSADQLMGAITGNFVAG